MKFSCACRKKLDKKFVIMAIYITSLVGFILYLWATYKFDTWATLTLDFKIMYITIICFYIAIFVHFITTYFEWDHKSRLFALTYLIAMFLIFESLHGIFAYYFSMNLLEAIDQNDVWRIASEILTILLCLFHFIEMTWIHIYFIHCKFSNKPLDYPTYLDPTKFLRGLFYVLLLLSLNPYFVDYVALPLFTCLIALETDMVSIVALQNFLDELKAKIEGPEKKYSVIAHIFLITFSFIIVIWLLYIIIIFKCLHPKDDTKLMYIFMPIIYFFIIHGRDMLLNKIFYREMDKIDDAKSKEIDENTGNEHTNANSLEVTV